MQLIIDTASTSLQVKNRAFLIQNEDISRQISPKRISSIAITSNCSLSASAIKLAAQNQIPVLFFSRHGTIQARTWSPYFTNMASLRGMQMTFRDEPGAIDWIKSLIKLKTELQIATLKKLSNRKPSIAPQTAVVINEMYDHLKKVSQNDNRPIIELRKSIMGYEGNLSKVYYHALQPFLPEKFKFKKRSRRPAMDYFNAALNYLYGMTYSVVESGVFAVGLDPFIGYLHVEDYSKTALVFDLIEPFRPIIDRLLIDLCQKNQLDKKHFVVKDKGWWLSKEGRKLLIPLYNEYLYNYFIIDQRRMRLKDHIFHESVKLVRVLRNTYNQAPDDLSSVL